jgi:hypothetical protein
MENKLSALKYIENIVAKSFELEQPTNPDMQYYIRTVNSLLVVFFKALYKGIIVEDKFIADIFINQYNILGLKNIFGDYSSSIYLLFKFYFKHANESPVKAPKAIELLIEFFNEVNDLDNDNIKQMIFFTLLNYLKDNKLLMYNTNFTNQLLSKLTIVNAPTAEKDIFYPAVKAAIYRLFITK